MPRRIPFYILDAFTDTPFAGNPAGVFVDDDAELSDEEMRLLAREVSLESAFVLPPTAGGDLRLRYFTGVTEVPLCGHDTIATMAALAEAGRIRRTGLLKVETPVGILSVQVTEGAKRDDPIEVTMFQNAPEYGPPLTGVAVVETAAALGCAPEVIDGTGLPVRRVSTGTPWLLAPVASRDAVDSAPGDRETILRLSQEQNAFGIYVFALETDEESGGLSVWSRCFAPIAGLPEDPVTGSASGALGGYLAAQDLLPPPQGEDGLSRFVARQGFAGGRGGTVKVAVGRDAFTKAVDRVAVTGTATLVGAGTFVLP